MHRAATHCNETQGNTLQHTATYCQTLQHTATHASCTLFLAIPHNEQFHSTNDGKTMQVLSANDGGAVSFNEG